MVQVEGNSVMDSQEQPRQSPQDCDTQHTFVHHPTTSTAITAALGVGDGKGRKKTIYQKPKAIM
jgi:hypothetical protein